MPDANQVNAGPDKTRTFKVAYYCMSCGREMFHSHETQPSIGYAECWECWGKGIAHMRDEWQKRTVWWGKAAGVMFVVGVIGGFLWGWSL